MFLKFPRGHHRDRCLTPICQGGNVLISHVINDMGSFKVLTIKHKGCNSILGVKAANLILIKSLSKLKQIRKNSIYKRYRKQTQFPAHGDAALVIL